MTPLSGFDRAGVLMITLLGTFIGLLIVSANDIRLVPMIVLLFPGLPVGWAVGMIAGKTTGVLAGGMSNGIAYGLLWYGGCRFTNFLAINFPAWLRGAGFSLRDGFGS